MFSFDPGGQPLLVSFPHSSTRIPDPVAAVMTGEGRAVPDTDWFLPELYDFVRELGVSVIAAGFSRYVIDPNRGTDGVNLYPGRPTPELCPLLSFAGEEIYLPGRQPDPFEIGRRTAEYWQPLHDRIQAELTRLRHRFGRAVLFDAHSIRSQVPRLFEGVLPDINIGTHNGQSCAESLEQVIRDVLGGRDDCSHVINGRFQGGYITRHYGQPAENIHAVQLELAQLRYMDEETGKWDDERAGRVRPILQAIVEAVLEWSKQPV